MVGIFSPGADAALLSQLQTNEKETHTAFDQTRDNARSFLDHVEEANAKGQNLSAEELAKGQKLLTSMEETLTRHTFNAAALAAQESLSSDFNNNANFHQTMHHMEADLNLADDLRTSLKQTLDIPSN